jgi:hypothetical protein
MFSKLKILLIAAITSTSSVTLAGTSLTLEPGSYKLIEGDRQLCQSFSLSTKDLDGRSISFGNLYSFEINNSLREIESDINPSCEFKEINQRLDDDGQTIISRTNEEFCREKLRSRTVSTATLSGNKIMIVHQIDQAQAYKCLFSKE